MTVRVKRDFTGGWGVFRDGHCVALCGENRAVAVATARDVRAGAPIVAFRRPTPKWL